MTIKFSHSQSIFEEAGLNVEYKSLIDRYFLMRFHPRKIVFDMIGAIWTTYFFWNQNWQAALLNAVVMGGMGLFFTRNIDPELMSQTTIGKIGLLHKHPINLTLNLIGIIVLLYGLWTHLVVTILIGLSVIILGHFFGWSNVNPKLRMI
ncbi:MAG: hypothetical protein PHY93_10235 [Bacteriovorax sp.]|nr:hypothetical protein [Bacteriovorax sp.]